MLGCCGKERAHTQESCDMSLLLQKTPQVNICVYDDCWQFELVYDMERPGGLARKDFGGTLRAEKENMITKLAFQMTVESETGESWLNLPKNSCNLRITGLDELTTT